MPEPALSDRYELGRVLGRGGMAEVREARDVVLDRRVAVKILHPALADDPTVIERFRREATSVASLNHPNLVGIYDAGLDGDTRYLVMEYLEGRTLADLVRDEGRLDPSRALGVGVAVAGALHAVHRAGLVHRDVKPANIMVTPRGVKLMDLGIARAADTTSLTATHTVVGTAAYLSPEQAQGLPADARSDIYSLGCVVFEAATGRRPFVGDTPVAVALQHVRTDPPAPSSLVAGLPPQLDTVLTRALAKDPSRRYATAAEMAEDLERVAGGLPVGPGVHDGEAPTQAMSSTDATAVHPGPVAATGAVAPTAAVRDPQEARRTVERRRGAPVALWLLGALVVLALLAVLAAANGLFDDGDGDGVLMPGGETTEPPTDPTEAPEPTPTVEQTTTTEETTTTTEAPAPDFGAVDDAVAAVRTEADQALADGELDASDRDNLVDKAADAATKARDGDDDALDDVDSLREELEDLHDDGDLSQPTYNRLRRAVDDLEAAIRAVL